jgi:serine O-acetyltransferase
MNRSNRFDFFEYLYADLSRAKQLQGFEKSSKWDLVFWFGIFSPRFMPVLLCRLSHLLYLSKVTPIAKAVSLINFIFFGLEVGIKCKIGKGLFIPHTSGIVIGAFSIGENAIIYQGVTIGARELDFLYSESSRPIIGNDVIISTGAVILGAVTIGDRSRIGANSVVLSSIPEDALAAGAPARIVRSFI